MTKEFIAEQMRALQSRICARLENIDGLSKFIEDEWEREEGGGPDASATRLPQNCNAKR